MEEKLLDAETMFNSNKRVISRNMNHIKSVYKVGKIIGLGNLGEIRKCKHIATHENRCIKMFSKVLIQKVHLSRIYYEIELIKTFDHPNII